jgi:hypothetical protein
MGLLFCVEWLWAPRVFWHIYVITVIHMVNQYVLLALSLTIIPDDPFWLAIVGYVSV